MKPRTAQHSPRKRMAPAEQTPATGKRTSHQPTRSRPRAKPAAAEQRVALLLEHFPGPDRERVSFSFYAPAAQTVFLAGSFNDWEPWATPLTNDEDGRWSVQLELRPGRHEYRFLVDGCWADDPLAPAFVPNPFGGLNCLLLVA